MFRSIYQDIKQQINFGNNVTRLIIINIAVFILLYICFVAITIYAGPGKYVAMQKDFVNFFSLSSDPMLILKRPWTIFTHMFLHRAPFHLIFNMLILYWFGRIFGDLMGDRRIVPLYILGALGGAILYIIASNFIIVQTAFALGASAGIMAIVIGAAYVAPDYEFRLILLGPVKLKFIALAMIVIDLVGTANMDNTGGHFAHVGGMITGWIFLTMIQNDNDPSPWFHRRYDWFMSLFDKAPKKKKSPLKVRHKASVADRNKDSRKSQSSAGPKTDTQSRLDSILDKISKKGISSLSQEEKDFLDNASKDK